MWFGSVSLLALSCACTVAEVVRTAESCSRPQRRQSWRHIDDDLSLSFLLPTYDSNMYSTPVLTPVLKLMNKPHLYKDHCDFYSFIH